MNGYEKIIKYRKWIAGFLAGGLIVNKGLSHVFPESLFMPFQAEFNTEKFSYQDMVSLIRSTRKDVGYKHDVYPFITSHFSTVCAGFSGFKNLKQSPVVGIPKQYLCYNVFEVEDLEIKFDINSTKVVDANGGPNEWAFLESLVLSEEAKKFDIARCLYVIEDNWALGQVCIPPIFVLLGYLACFSVYFWLFKDKKVTYRHMYKWQVTGIVATWILCKFTQSLYNYTMFKSIDKKAASLSKEYALGAIEYCKKIKQSNQALRILLGKKGERMYTIDGDYASKLSLLLRRNEQSLSLRQKQFEDILSKL